MTTRHNFSAAADFVRSRNLPMNLVVPSKGSESNFAVAFLSNTTPEILDQISKLCDSKKKECIHLWFCQSGIPKCTPATTLPANANFEDFKNRTVKVLNEVGYYTSAHGSKRYISVVFD